MSDSTLNVFLGSATTAERVAFTPTPPSPATGFDPGYVVWDSDLQQLFAWDAGGAAWVQVGGGAGSVTGPGASTDNAIARWNGTGGTVLQDSTPTVEDDGTIASLTDPANLQDAATKNYVDTQIAAVNVGGAAQNSFLVSGGQVVWTSNYNFLVSSATYYIQGVLYSSAADTITLDAADPTNDRLDVIVLDDTGSVDKVTGVASATPSEPDIDLGTQLQIALVLVSAASTQPDTATSVLVYEDNAGSPTEWDWVSSDASIDVNSTNNPRGGSTHDIEGTAVVAGVYAQGEIGSGTLTPSDYELLVCYIWSKATWNPKRGLQVSLLSSGVQVGSVVSINKSGSFGFDSSDTSAYQQVAIPIANFNVSPSATITQVRFTDFGGSIGFYLDDITFQVSGNGGTVVQGITQAQADTRYLQIANNLTDLSNVTTATAQLNAMVGDSGAGGTKGMVPAPAAGDAAAGKFLKADGTFAVPPGAGGTPGGADTQVQYNNAGSFGGITGATTDGTALTLVAPVLGTPASGTLTNATGLPISTGVSGLGTGVATFLATPSSANLASALTDETGSGAAVFATSPTLVTPALGTPASGVLTNCTGLPTTGLVDAAVTLAKIQNASANSKLLGSGATGSGSPYTELTLGTNLSMSGTTLNASGGGSAGTLVARATAAANAPPTSNPASFGTRGAIPLWNFDDTTQEVAVFPLVCGPDYAGGNITVYLQWAAATATTGTIGWDVAFANLGGGSQDLDAISYAAAQTVTAATVPATSGDLLITNVAVTAGTATDNIAAGQLFLLRVRRDVATDTATGDAQLLALYLKEV